MKTNPQTSKKQYDKACWNGLQITSLSTALPNGHQSCTGLLLTLQKPTKWSWSLAWSDTVLSSRCCFSGWKDYFSDIHRFPLLSWKRDEQFNKPNLTVIVLEGNGSIVKREKTVRSSKKGWYQCHNWHKGQPLETAYSTAISMVCGCTDPADHWSCEWIGYETGHQE